MSKVLICDLVGLKLNEQGQPDHSEIERFIVENGGVFHTGNPADNAAAFSPEKINFYYQPWLSTEAELLLAGDGTYDAVIAAATIIPASARFDLGGVRIGAGTGNMTSRSWGGGSGLGGSAPLMNTPGTNSRATAQMVMKALLRALPDLPLDLLHDRVLAGDFDTRRDIQAFPTEKLEGKRIAVLGFGNIGSEVARLAKAFHMNVAVYARPAHEQRILAEGFEYAADPRQACEGADVLSIHVGLGKRDDATGRYANSGIVDAALLSALRSGAVVINFDRGEVVNVDALYKAMQDGHVRNAFIDADIFRDVATGEISGPLAPYIEPARALSGRLALYPHVAADTDHPSRVEGAKRAVTQIMDAINHKRVRNLVGDLPPGYHAG